ncbi:MAG: tetratricopeptide repeat protein [Saprospiraceae bacterium]|nr:tetratricopeptide repeat protein [Saprospiraceae bacterium]
MRKLKLSTTLPGKRQAVAYQKYLFLLIGLTLLTNISLFAQQVSEKEVALQEKFIDASREHLLGHYEKAAAIYEEILKTAPNNDAAAYELSRVYNAQNDGEKALRYIRMAIESAPDNPWYRRYLADLYQKQNKNKEAADVYGELSKKDPTNEEYYYTWAYFLVKANEINAALKVYDDFEKRIGINEEVIRRKHSLYVGLGNNRKAAEELQRLINAFPKSVEYRHLLAGFYEQIGERDLALNVYKETLKIDPNDSRSVMALAGTSGRQSDEIEYLRSLQPIFQKSDINIDLKIAKLMPFITKVADTGDKTIAVAALELTQTLETVHPQEAKGFAASADLLYYSGEPIKALEKYKKTLELDDTVFLVWEQLLSILRETKDYAALQKYSEEAMDLFPNKAQIYYLNGIANLELNRPTDALSSLEQATLMAGNNGNLLFEIQIQKGLVLNNLKKYDASNETFEQALKLHPKSAEALRLYSHCLAQRSENLQKAKTMAKQAVDIAPKNPDYQATYGWVMYKMKDYGEAKEWLGKALENGGANDPMILEHYGDVLFQMNDTEGALQYWVKAQEKGNTSEILEKKITDRRLYD